MIEPMLVLSTAHLDEQTCNGWLRTAAIAVYEKADYGWFIPVPEDEPESAPADLVACFALARSLHCDWLMFDRDADTHPILPVHEW